MQLLSVDEIKKIELEMLKNIDDFCVNNHLSYFITGGTLLGAVRHKGFIPWDDDIDIFMPRQDYERFVENYNKQDGVYITINGNNSEGYPYSFAKVTDTRTKIKEFILNDYEGGVFIDVFPLDYLGNDKNAILELDKKLHVYRKLLEIKTFSLRFKRGFIKKTELILSKILVPFLNRKKLIYKINEMAQSLWIKNQNNKYCAAMVILTYGVKEIMESSWYSDYVYLSFENYQFRAPIGYKNILEHFYGDYMKLPPKEKQVTHHSFDAWYK